MPDEPEEEELRRLRARAAELRSRMDGYAQGAEVRLGELSLAQSRGDQVIADLQRDAAQLHIDERRRLDRELATVEERIKELEKESRPSRKNVYIPADAREVWDQAERLAGESLSSLLTDLLRGFVDGKQAEADGWERIVVSVMPELPSDAPHYAFWGRWVIGPDEAYSFGDYAWALAKTRRGRIAIYAITDQNGSLYDYDSLDQANGDYPIDFLAEAARRLGRPDVKELDI